MSAHNHDHEKCLEYFEKISELLDGELDPATSEKVRRHIEACPECKVCFSTFEKSVELFKAWGRESFSDKYLHDLKDFVRRNLEQA